MIPEYVRYAYVLTGYRTGGTHFSCAMDLFAWHAETLNAWSMIVCGLASVGYYCRFGSRPRRLAAEALTASCVLQVVPSVGFHLFRGIGIREYSFWRRLDQCFIFVNSVFLAYALSATVYASPWAVVANTGTSAALSAVACAEILRRAPHVQRRRGAIVATVGLTVLGHLWPVLWWSYAHRDWTYAAAALAWLGAGGALFATGTPERWWPRRFDVIGSSHQLMHACAGAAHLVEWHFVLHVLKEL